MSIQRLPSNTQFFTESPDSCLSLAHGGHGKTELGLCHLELPAALSASGSGRGQAGDCSLGDQFLLKFGEGCKDAGHQLAGSCGRVDSSAVPCQYLVAMAALAGDKILTQLVQEFEVHPNQITEWKRQLF